MREKGGTSHWQPVSPTLMRHLLTHHAERGDGDRDGSLLRYRDGRPLTYRRYDHLWARIGQHLRRVHTQQISTHWLRHTTLTWVERSYGHAVARAYAGHTDGGGSGATATYVRATLQEVAIGARSARRSSGPGPTSRPHWSRYARRPRTSCVSNPAGHSRWDNSRSRPTAQVQVDVFDACDQVFMRAQQAGIVQADADLTWTRQVYIALISETAHGVLGTGDADPDTLAARIIYTLLYGVSGRPGKTTDR
ncbi:hypothetical protein ACQEVC_34995 [Plantactinospora sp. CA-294935]|uniref:hypothetical protein n=1 Tax=Plantactinospora sp. CA-294935 TaxID=3240012 RepID=UPI003D8F3C71